MKRFVQDGQTLLSVAAQQVRRGSGLLVPLTLGHDGALERLGLGKIESIRGLDTDVRAMASYGKMRERSPGKDTISGHWEIAGCILDHPFATFPDGFPDDIIRPFCKRIGAQQ